MLGWGLLVASLLVAFPIAVHRATRDWKERQESQAASGDSAAALVGAIHQGKGSDTPKFHAAGRYVREHRDIEPSAFMKYYWPSVDVALAGLAWMPLPMFAAVWYAIGCASWLGLLWAIYALLCATASQKGTQPPATHHPPPATRLPRQATLAAGLLMTPLAMDHLFLGAFHILMLWLMVAGLGRVSRGRSWSGGILLGLGVCVKLLPLLGVGYLVLKRKWLAAAVAVASAIIVDLALTLPVFGPAKTWELHAKWWEGQAQGAAERTLTSVEWIDEDRVTNQSLAMVLRRLLTHMGWRDTSPEGIQAARAEGWDAFPDRNQVALAEWSPDRLRTVYLVMSGVLGLAVLVFCRRPGRLLVPARWATEIALVALCTLWFSPVVWGYHFTAATPALAAISARRAAQPRRAWTGAALWLAVLASFAWRLARAFGAALWLTFLVGAIMVWTRDEERGMRDEGRDIQ